MPYIGNIDLNPIIVVAVNFYSAVVSLPTSGTIAHKQCVAKFRVFIVLQAALWVLLCTSNRWLWRNDIVCSMKGVKNASSSEMINGHLF